MKELIKSAAVWAAIICILPAAARGIPSETSGASPAGASVRSQQLPSFSVAEDILQIYDGRTGETAYVPTEDYTVYALLAEIPYIMDGEAMKAQAVAARTYAVRRIISGGDDSINGAHISHDSSEYQICLTDPEARAMYGDDYEKALDAARKAVTETRGQILVYENSPIIAAFHTSSAGITEAAENVWGTCEPYLSATVSEGDLYSPYHGREKTFTAAEISARMLAEYPQAVSFDGFSEENISPSGTVLSVTLCGVSVSGAELARLLTLDSAAFSWECGDEAVTFTINGCGHLAGMSMYGADHMSKNGSDYKEILSHYYSGAELCTVYTGE